MIAFDALKLREKPIAVVGLGYVGLPLAVALARHFSVIGFDILQERVAQLRGGVDKTGEVTPENLAAAKITYSATPEDLADAAIIIVAVPTPVTRHRQPDLTPVFSASRLWASTWARALWWCMNLPCTQG